MKLMTLITAMAAGGVLFSVQAQDQAEAPLPDSPFQPDLTPGYVLIEGDIQVPLHQYTARLGGFVPAGTFGGVLFWPNNDVPFDFVTAGNGAVSPANQTAAINAMNAIAQRAGLTFRAATAGDGNRIRFQNSAFNNSPVGMRLGVQVINIFNWGNQIIICHEIYHSLGFWHEQSRSDRGAYVTINANNICGSASSGPCAPATCQQCPDVFGSWTSCAFNFAIEGGSVHYGPYDFDSFMHYGRGDFSCNGADTITVNPPWNAQWQNAIGQRDHFSYFDAITCRGLYPFAGDRWVERSHFGISRGTFWEPYSDNTLAGALAGVPSGGTLFIKEASTYNGVGTHRTPVTIIAPNGATLGN